jgi:ribose transport system substrate-binding protein
VVWVCTSDALGGVLAAEAQAGRGPYDVFTWDLSEPSIQALRDGKVAGVLYLPADKSAEQLADLIDEAVKAGDSWTPKTVPADAVVVTPDNVEQYATSK